MQQSPRERSARALRARRANPASSSTQLPTTPVYVTADRQRWPRFPAGRARGIFFRFVLVGLLLELCFLLLYPLLGEARPTSFAAQALPQAWPWLTRFCWTNQFPALVALISRLPWFNLQATSPVPHANLALLLLILVAPLLLLAIRTGQYAEKKHLSKGQMRLLLLLTWLFTLLFGIAFVLLPGGLAQETLLSGLYGRLILLYHVNPYLSSPTLLVHDPFYQSLAPGTFAVPRVGPLWLDLMVLPAWLARANPVALVLILRAAGLALHLANTLLIWGILAKLKPEIRLTGTLLYAWNPALLLLGVTETQINLATIFFLLAGIFLLQRSSLLIGWACLVLAALIDPLCLLLLPLFWCALTREKRPLSPGQRVLWWLLLLGLAVLIATLAYAPYWSGLGLNGIAPQLRAPFWQDTAQSSLLAALDKLSFAGWPPAAWLLTPHHWLLLPALLIGGLLLLGLWIIDSLELALLFGSWIFLALFLLLPVNTPWLILLPLVLSLTSASRRTALLAHLLTAGALVAYCLAYWPTRWDGQALVTSGLTTLIWGWTLFFFSTWQITHREDQEEQPATRKRLSLSRPSWPSRPTAWPSRPRFR